MLLPMLGSPYLGKLPFHFQSELAPDPSLDPDTNPSFRFIVLFLFNSMTPIYRYITPIASTLSITISIIIIITMI